MLRSEIRKSLNNCAEFLKNDAVERSLLGPAVKDGSTALVFTAMEAAISFRERASNNDLEMIGAFKLDAILTVQFWVEVATNPKRILMPARNAEALKRANAFLSSIIYPDPNKTEPDNVLRVFLPENEELSNPKRISMLLGCIEELSEIVCSAYDIDASGISIMSLDSGSNKVIDFKGSGEIISTLGSILLQFWEKIAFYKHETRMKRIKEISQSMDVFSDIQKREEKGELKKGEAEKLRKKLETNLGVVSTVGAYTEDFEARSVVHPQLVMQPERRLLSDMRSPHEITSTRAKDTTSAQNAIEDADVATDNPSAGDELTSDERKMLQRYRESKNE